MMAQPAKAGKLTIDRDWAGQPDIAYVDPFRRTVATICFPFLPGMVVSVGPHKMTMVEERNNDEQAVVSRFLNKNGFFIPQAGLGDMHASHSAKHGLCGSSYRTNFHPVSATCNTGRIAHGFEAPLVAIVQKCYGGLGPNFDIAAAPVVVIHVTYTWFDPEVVLPYLVGNDSRTVFSNRKKSVMCGFLYGLAEAIPCRQIREAWEGTLNLFGGRDWKCSLSQTLAIAEIMEGAGSPEKPRYRLDKANEDNFNTKWFESGCPLTGLALYSLSVQLDQVAVNCTMFEFLKALTGLKVSPLWNTLKANIRMLGGADSAVKELAQVDAEARMSLPKFNYKEKKVKDLFDMHVANRGLGAWHWGRAEAWNYLKKESKGDPGLLDRWKTLFYNQLFPDGVLPV